MIRDKPPLATYRVQFNRDFCFEEARALVPYLSRLGVTHLYSSPILRARAGSTHGYDVVDPKTLNPELGTETDFRALLTTLQAHGMGILLDIVPNHMAAGNENPYWQDVLTYGLGSPYARWFDIDWRLPDPELWGRVLVPVLGEPLPRVIARDQLGVIWSEGRFSVRYYEHSFPLDPATLPGILLFGLDDLQQSLEPEHPALEELRRILQSLRALPRRTTRMRRKNEMPFEEIQDTLSRLAQLIESSPQIHDWVARTCRAFGEGPDGHRRLRKLLAAQSYRLAYWRRAARVLNYRRFFDINDLISLRQEDPEVFDETHELIIRWAREGLLDGLRIDHLDGLRDPRGYLERLSEVVSVAENPRQQCLIFVEKILAPEEHLPETWPVAGTSGYEFLNQLEGIFISPEGAAEIEQQYRRMLRRPIHFEQVAHWGKRRVLKAELSAFVGRLGDILFRLARNRPENSGLTHRELVEAIVEVAVCLPVYRTYIDARYAEVTPEDRHAIETALAGARRRERAAPAALEFLAEVLLLARHAGLPENEQQERLHFIERFQQLTGPAAAKGVEDTALYVYVPLISRNEVGGEPEFPLDAAAERFHHANRERAASWPWNMLCVTTHDTKRSADVRSRLDVLSELPKIWTAYVNRWRRWNRPHRKRVQGRAVPDVGTEYLLYQTLAGVWPAPAPHDPDRMPEAGELEELRERVEQYMLKAAREAKTRTSWVDPDAEFEESVTAFLRGILSSGDEGPSPFLADLNHFVARIARPGFWNGLSRTLIHFTAPGTPDLYQGDEVWNFSLVDPDNRRPVDFEHRKQLLDTIVREFESQEETRQALLRELVATPEDGRIKLHVIRCALYAHREHPSLFASGEYEPLATDGPAGERLFAFARYTNDEAALIVVPRFTATLAEDPAQPPVGETVWSGTTLRLPDRLRERVWKSALTGETRTLPSTADSSTLAVSDVLYSFPVALLIAEGQ